MRNIKLMGKEYSEEMINVLSDYDRFMSDALLDKVRDDGYINVFELVSIKALQLSRESKAVLSESTDIEAKAVQPVKADQPIDVTELGMVIEVRAMQFPKAHSPILVTELGMVTEVSASQSVKA